MSDIMQLKGGVYLIDRTASPLPLLGGTLVARLASVGKYKLGTASQIGRKGNGSPSWGRINGNWIEMDATFVELTENFMKVVTNQRNSGTDFSPDPSVYKDGTILTDQNYTALVIRDEDSPLSYPALYIPYCYCIDNGFFAFRDGELMEGCDLSIVSVHYDRNVKPYEWGDITGFDGYEEEGGA